MPWTGTGRALVAGRYSVEADAAEQAPGVWRGYDTKLPRPVAILAVPEPPGLAGEARAAWLASALAAGRAATAVRHHRIVSTYEAAEVDGRVLLVTDVAGAPSMSQVVDEGGRLARHRAAALGADVAAALAAIHATGLAHGTICPGTVAVAAEGARVAHVGLGAAAGDVHEERGALAGCGPFVAPDARRAPSPAGDAWSLGALLLWAVEGRTPADGPPTHASGALQPLLERLLNPEPSLRPAAATVQAELTDLAARLAAEATAGRRRRRSRHAAGAGENGSAAAGDDVEVAAGRGEEPEGAERAEGRRHRRRRRRRERAEVAEEVWVDGPGELGGDSRAEGVAGGEVPAVVPDTAGGDESESEPAGESESEGEGEPAGEAEGEAEGAAGPGRPAITVLGLQVVPEGGPPAVPATEPEAPRTEEEERRFRATPSWPPPRRVRIGLSILSVLVMVVLVALLLTNGAIISSDTTTDVAGSGDTPAATIPPDWVAYRDPDLNYGLSHPPDWTVRRDGRVTEIRDPRTSTFLRVDWAPPAEPGIEQAFLDRERAFAVPDRNYRRLQITPTTFGGFPGAVWEFTFTDAGAAFHAVHLAVDVGQQRFGFYFQSPAAAWNDMLGVFTALANSFRPPA
jgi:serine/threonine protein kinase